MEEKNNYHYCCFRVYAEISFYTIVRTTDKTSKQIMEDRLWVNVLISFKAKVISFL